MQAHAIIFEKPGKLCSGAVELLAPGDDDVVVEILWSGISTGTERLLWEGRMPFFPGLGYPLVPGYESVGEIVHAGTNNKHRIGERVFVPGCAAYREVKGLFGGSASRLVANADRVLKVEQSLQHDAVLYALAATAHHAIAGGALPDLVVGCGVLGRLVARMTVALGGEAPVIWETDHRRRSGTDEYRVVHPQEDKGSQYKTIVDVTGDSNIIDELVGNLAPAGEVVLAGFYPNRLSFAFPPAFMKEARLRVSAEWKSADMQAVSRLVGDGLLSLAGLVTHHSNINDAAKAYDTAFGDAHCLKMVLDWRGAA